jgi:hypothetical protein
VSPLEAQVVAGADPQASHLLVSVQADLVWLYDAVEKLRAACAMPTAQEGP